MISDLHPPVLDRPLVEIRPYRDARGRYRAAATALERFLAKCRYDPCTGCVVWVGGKTRGRGKTSWYGSFWYQGRRWTAHRWAAKFIHGLEIDDLTVDHKCGNTLCQAHLQAIPGLVNAAFYWIRVEVGIFQPPPDLIDEDGALFYAPPPWFPAVLPINWTPIAGTACEHPDSRIALP